MSVAIASSIERQPQSRATLLLNPDEQAQSKRIFLYRGLGFRISRHETAWHLDQAVLSNQQQPPPAPSHQPNPSFGYIQERSHHILG